MQSFILEQKYINQIASKLNRFKEVQPSERYNFRCEICGDSDKSEYKARGWFFRESTDNIFLFKCFNCGFATSFQHYLKMNHPDDYKELRLELFKERGIREFEPKKKKDYNEAILSKESQKKLSLLLNNNLIPIHDLPNNHIAKKYLIKRQIPKNKWNKIGYVKDFEDFIHSNCEQWVYKNKNIPNDERIVFILKSHDEKIIGFQARALDPNCDLRYMTIMLSKQYPKVFGLNDVIKDKPIIVTEGAFDSLLLNNAISVNGGDANSIIELAELSGIPKERFIIALDNEPRSENTIKRFKKAMDLGLRIAIWKGIDERYKDINEMILNGLSSTQIESHILNNNYSGLKAKLHLTNWKKV